MYPMGTPYIAIPSKFTRNVRFSGVAGFATEEGHDEGRFTIKAILLILRYLPKRQGPRLEITIRAIRTFEFL